MIITILPQSTTFHAVAYNEKKVENGHAFLLEALNISGLRPEAYTADKLRMFFEEYSSRNTRIQNAQFHVAISCKGQEYTHEQLLDIAHRYLKEMGYAKEGQPVLIYAHHDTPNNHIHIITSRVAPDGHRISDKFEKKRSREITERIMKEYEGIKFDRVEKEANNREETISPPFSGRGLRGEALSYKYSTLPQFFAILESQGYDCKDDDDKHVVHVYRNMNEVGIIPTQLIMQHAIKDNRPDDKRRRQLRAILKKYRDLSANKEELAAVMKKEFGISLVFFGHKDSPYGYAVVDHKNKTVYKGGEFIGIRELLQFEDAATRFAKIEQTIDDILRDDPTLTTRDINRLLYRQFGTRIHKGTVSWNGESITLNQNIQERLLRNNRVGMGLSPEPVKVTRHPQQASKDNMRNSHPSMLQDVKGGSKDANHEYEVGGNMDVSGIDDEQSQRAKWRR